MQFSVGMPDWADDECAHVIGPLESLEARMAEVIRFARLNVEHNTGGPFAAGVFEEATGKLVAMGVNRVVPENCSSAHAEVVALSLAQVKLDSFDLGSRELPAHQLVVNWRPCVMCYGAVLWSGVRSLVIAGSDEQMEELTGFDEGPMILRWKDELRRRGISLEDNVMKAESLRVFREFRDAGRFVYNARGGS